MQCETLCKSIPALWKLCRKEGLNSSFLIPIEATWIIPSLKVVWGRGKSFGKYKYKHDRQLPAPGTTGSLMIIGKTMPSELSGIPDEDQGIQGSEVLVPTLDHDEGQIIKTENDLPDPSGTMNQ